MVRPRDEGRPRHGSAVLTIPPRRAVLVAVALAVAIEALACALRFGLGWESTRDTAAMGRLTLGLRVHHAYLGAVLMLVAACLRPSRVRDGLLILGAALVASDLAHHFLVLWPITGSPQFDLTYGRAALLPSHGRAGVA